jgi:hypothetical protein
MATRWLANNISTFTIHGLASEDYMTILDGLANPSIQTMVSLKMSWPTLFYIYSAWTGQQYIYFHWQ